MFDPAFIEVKMETLKTHEFHTWWNFITVSCDRREDRSYPVISLDPIKCLPFWVATILILNRSNDLSKFFRWFEQNTHFFIKPTADIT